MYVRKSFLFEGEMYIVYNLSAEEKSDSKNYVVIAAEEMHGFRRECKLLFSFSSYTKQALPNTLKCFEDRI